jgi:diacylglycerol kinase family enzyme
MSAQRTLVASVVGIDGCGKSSAFRGALELLAPKLDVVGIGDEVLAGSPVTAVQPRRDLPFQRMTALATGRAKRTRWSWAYRQLKTLDLIGRSRMRDHIVAEEAPAALLTDGDPLVNTMAWSVGRLYRGELGQDDRRVLDALRYLAGERRIPRDQLAYYLRHAWQLALVNRLGIARFRPPDLVILLRLDGAAAMKRIRSRGRPLQAHETEAALTALGAGYDRICRLIEAGRSVHVVRIEVDRTPQAETARLVAEAILDAVPTSSQPAMGDREGPAIEVVATTISGSLRDQRKIGRIGPSFAARTRRPVHVHAVDSHPAARDLTSDLVRRGGRLIVSAGGAGTFNAVLEGCHLDGRMPEGVRLAFLRKGSADLIGKMLRIPDDLPGAVDAIVDGIEQGRRVPADVIAVTASCPADDVRHIIGFGGLGIFGAVPLFTEARWVRLYKGVLGSLFGDYGPFYTGLALATLWWYAQRFLGRVSPLTLEFDADTVGPARWNAVIVVGGDLGPAFPLGRGAVFSSGTFRVVALQDYGPRQALRQLAAARSGALLEAPERYGCLIRDTRTLVVRPLETTPGRGHRSQPVNVDGLDMTTCGELRFSLSGRVELVAGP